MLVQLDEEKKGEDSNWFFFVSSIAPAQKQENRYIVECLCVWIKRFSYRHKHRNQMRQAGME